MNNDKHKKTNAKKTTKAISLYLALGLSLGIITGATMTIHEREEEYKQTASDFVGTTIRQNNTLCLDDKNNDYILPEYKKYTTISRGKYLAQILNDMNMDYCILLGEYYTKDGLPIAEISKKENDKLVDTRVEVIKNPLDPIDLESGEVLVLVKTKPYSELEKYDMVVKMPEHAPTEVEYQGETMYQGDIILKR